MKRKIKNFLISPKQQKKFVLQFIGVSGIFSLLFFTHLSFHIHFRYQSLKEQLPPETITEIPKILTQNDLILIILTLAFLIFSVSIILILRTHRIFGPMVPIRRFLGELIEGNYKSRVQLRKKDDFQELAKKLNTLAETIEKKYPQN